MNDILNMQASTELDQLVAIKIMGYESSNMRDGWVRIGALATYPKRYSRDINAAWEVEEKMNTDELFWRYTHHVKKILLSLKPEGVNEYDMMHASPEVRCKAALLALEGNRGD